MIIRQSSHRVWGRDIDDMNLHAAKQGVKTLWCAVRDDIADPPGELGFESRKDLFRGPIGQIGRKFPDGGVQTGGDFPQPRPGALDIVRKRWKRRYDERNRIIRNRERKPREPEVSGNVHAGQFDELDGIEEGVDLTSTSGRYPGAPAIEDEAGRAAAVGQGKPGNRRGENGEGRQIPFLDHRPE